MTGMHASSPAMSPAVWAMLLALGTIWGGSFLFARIAVQEIAPLTLVLLRVGIAAAALQIYLALAGPSFRLAAPMARSFFILALLNNVIPFSLMFTGQTAIGAGLASVLNATTPFWTMILANALTADDKLTPNKIAGIVLGIAGTGLMIGPGLVGDLGGPAWAKFCIIGMAFSYALAFIYARRFRALPPQIVATGQLSAATVIMIPTVLLFDGTAGLAGASGGSWAAVLGLSLLSTAFAYILYFSIMRAAGSTNASLVTFIVPVSGVLLGVFLLGERMEWFELAGMAVIAVGLIAIDGRLIQRR